MAYIGIGKNELRQGNYVKAMKLFKKADDTVDYSKAFKKYRQVIGTKATGIAVCVIIIVIAAIFIIKKIVKKHKKSESRWIEPFPSGSGRPHKLVVFLFNTIN